MGDRFWQTSRAFGIGFLFLIAGLLLASLVTYPIRQGIYNAPDAVTSWFRHHGYAAIAVEWVPAFLHGLVAGVAGMLGGHRVARDVSPLILATSLAIAFAMLGAYGLVSKGDAIGLFERGKLYLEVLGCLTGLAAVCAILIGRRNYREP